MFTDNYNPNVPGEVQEMTFVDKQIHVYPSHCIIPITIAANTGDLDKGTLMGVSTSDGLYRPLTRTTVKGAQNIVSPQIINVATGTGSKFIQGQTVSAMKVDGTGVQALGTITAVNGDSITVSTALTAAMNDGEYFFVSDGSQKALVVLAWPIMDASQAKIGQGELGGCYYEDQLVGVDPVAVKDLGARQIPDNILIIPC